MKANNTSHPDCRNEHQFEEKCQGLEKKETKNKEKTEKKGASLVKVIEINILIIVLATALLEWFPVSDIYKKVVWKIIEIAGSAVLTLAFTLFLNNDKISAKGNGFKAILSCLKEIFTKKALVVVFLMVYFLLNFFVVETLAEYGFTGRILNACEEAVEGFKSYDKENDNLFEKNELTAEQNEWIEEQDSELVREVKNSEVPESERKVVKNLSNADKNKIFFLDKITDWENQEVIDRIVYDWVKEQREKKLENTFDKSDEAGGAPTHVETAISNASKNEKDARFVERKGIMEERSNIYGDYPKYSLSNLISNDNHALALALYYYCGQDSTIMYYYGQSILYNMDGIAYAEVSDSTCKERLTAISQRYLDIDYTCEECGEVVYAKKLAIAFQYAADQY